ncbi:Acetyltransferase (GNAT) family protein [Trichlorobacter thiogenes]|uniref:Acetyltransferase (GNAT) family protein n=1 Tax=Trichlorobacter thiogenes TaxID=115783 RepID=A0A1T4S4Y0_9BACT|nr:GNAT family N-acetyltransferase [Trichlorobacter thiogenes]SKA23349.1 Acetyltransferase (GNAT) family protein [Trichlorobacter thiogenes]
MTQEDVHSVFQVQAECYVSVALEDESTMRTRLVGAPDTAWVAEDNEGVGAYLVAYRSIIGKVTPLGGCFDIPDNAESLYLHDLAVSDRMKGHGIGSALVRHACDRALQKGLTYSSLVSVQDSMGFWIRHGFKIFDLLDPVQLSNLKTYGELSVYMIKEITVSKH